MADNLGQPVPGAEERAGGGEDGLPRRESPSGVLLYSGTPVMAEMSKGGGEEGLPRRESLSGVCRRLSELPNPVPHFVNREQELSKIKEFLSQEWGNDCSCVLIHGAVGMGKTSTAIKAANEIRDNSDNTAVIYVDCKDTRSLDDLARKISKQVYHCPFNEPVSEVKRRLLNEEDLNTLLLLLDNFEHLESSTQPEGGTDAKEVEEILNFIREIVRRSPKVKLLVTTSLDVQFLDAGQKWIRLHSFKDEDSYQLLKNVYGDRYQLDKETAGKIAQFCSGIPHALNILASQQDYPPDLVEMMTNSNARKKFEKFTRIPLAEKEKKLDVCLDACFERLDPHLQNTLVSLTLFRGRFTILTAEKIFPSEEIEDQILTLTKRSFLEQNILNRKGPCWYSFLAIQSLYCQNKAQKPRFHEVYRGARNLFIEYFLDFLEDDFKKFLSINVSEAITSFRQEEEDIIQLLDWFENGAMKQDQMETCIDVFNKVGGLLTKMLTKKRFETVFTKLKQKCEEMEDQRRLSECLTSLGVREVFNLFFSTCLQPDEAAEKAKRYLVEAHRIQTVLKINTGNSRAQCLAKLGRIRATEDKFLEARDTIQQAIDIRIQHEEQDSAMLGATYNDMAVAISLEAVHQQEGARELLQQAIDIRENKTLPIYRKKLAEHHPFTATILDSLSENYHALGHLDIAKRYAEEGLQIRQKELNDHIDTAKSLFNLAMIHKTMREFTEARKYLQKCEAMQRKVLDDNHRDLERTRRELEDVNRQLGNMQWE